MELRGRVLELLMARVRACRLDGLVFAVLTAIVTPPLVIAAIVVAMLFAFEGRGVDVVSSPAFAVHATFGVLLVLFGVALSAPLPRWGMADRRFIAFAVFPLAAMGVLAWLAGWPGAIAVWLWWPFALLGVATLALLGRAYECREVYTFGWFGGWMDETPTLRADFTRPHARMGYIIALPRLLLGAWADLAACVWMLREPRSDEYATAVDLLLALGTRNHDAVRAAMDSAGPPTAKRAAQLLGRIGLLTQRRDRPCLSSRAIDLLEAAQGHVLA